MNPHPLQSRRCPCGCGCFFQPNRSNQIYLNKRHADFHYNTTTRKLKDDEIAEFMKKYMIRSKLDMSRIYPSDPIAKWLGLKQGDIVKIIRYNENSGESFYYRSCF